MTRELTAVERRIVRRLEKFFNGAREATPDLDQWRDGWDAGFESALMLVSEGTAGAPDKPAARPRAKGKK